MKGTRTTEPKVWIVTRLEKRAYDKLKALATKHKVTLSEAVMLTK